MLTEILRWEKMSADRHIYLQVNGVSNGNYGGSPHVSFIGNSLIVYYAVPTRDQGKYRCKINSVAGESTVLKDFEIRVRQKLNISLKINPSRCELGGAVELICSVSTNTGMSNSLIISWLKDAKPLTRLSNRIRFFSNNVIQVSVPTLVCSLNRPVQFSMKIVKKLSILAKFPV